MGSRRIHLNQPFGYTGYQEDVVSETYFAQVREYKTRIGRFVAEDIMGGNAIKNTAQKAYKVISTPLVKQALIIGVSVIAVAAGATVAIGVTSAPGSLYDMLTQESGDFFGDINEKINAFIDCIV